MNYDDGEDINYPEEDEEEDEDGSDCSIIDHSENFQNNDKTFYEKVPDEVFAAAHQRYNKLFEPNRRKEAVQKIHMYYRDQCRRFHHKKISPDAIVAIINSQYAEYEEFKRQNEAMFNRYMNCLVTSMQGKHIVELPADTVEVMIPHFI